MEEKELLDNESGEEKVNDDGRVDYISAINEMKQNTVPRKQYEELQKENKELLDTLINGGQMVINETVDKPSIKDLREELYGKDAVDNGMNNLEYVKKSLELRKAIIESGGVDPFLPVGKGIEITREDVEAAEFAAQQFQECIDIAKGNSEVFTNELMRRTVDNSLPTAKKSNYYRR